MIRCCLLTYLAETEMSAQIQIVKYQQAENIWKWDKKNKLGYKNKLTIWVLLGKRLVEQAKLVPWWVIIAHNIPKISIWEIATGNFQC